MNALAFRQANFSEMRTRIQTAWPFVEDGIIATTLSLVVLVPVVELVLRGLFRTGIFAAAALEQHLGLVVAMLGAAIAARENRLLALSVLPTLLRGRARIVVVAIAGSIGVAVCLLLAWASFQFVVAERGAAKMLTYHVPVWLVQSVMPVGFTIIAWRLLRHTVSPMYARIAVLVAAILFLVFVTTQSAGPALVVCGALVALGIAAIFGRPTTDISAALSCPTRIRRTTSCSPPWDPSG